eukprot:scpid68391/ scgid24468/ 
MHNHEWVHVAITRFFTTRPCPAVSLVMCHHQLPDHSKCQMGRVTACHAIGKLPSWARTVYRHGFKYIGMASKKSTPRQRIAEEVPITSPLLAERRKSPGHHCLAVLADHVT